MKICFEKDKGTIKTENLIDMVNMKKLVTL